MPVVFSARSVPQPQSVNPPTVPTGVVANALSTSMIEVDWNPSTDPGGPGVKDYGVYRFGVLIQRVVAPTTTFTDTGLSQGTSYTYTVTSRDLNNLESAQSAPATAQTQGGIVDGSQLSINGSGFGTKSRTLAPIVWDNQKDTAPSTHAVSPQYAPTQTSPLNATGGVFYDMQNRPPGWAPSGYQAGLPHPFLGGTITGCHLRQVNGPNVNEYNDVMVGVAGTVPTTTFCFRHEYYMRYDANWVPNPRSDQNLKEFSYNEGLVIQPPANFVYFTGPANASSVESNIRGITNANPCVISYVWPFATAPVSVGDTVIPFGVPGMTQINGLQCVVTNVAGANPNYQATIGALNSTSFGVHPGILTVTAITKGSQSTTPARVTFTAPGANPCVGGENVGFSGVGGMTQINIQNLLQQITVLDAGGSGATCFVDIDLDTTGFTTYTSGGSICFGMAPTTWGPWTTTRQLTTDGTAQGSPTGMWQNPDKNGRSGSSLSFWNQFFWRTNAANGWMKWLIEGCYDTTTGGAGYVNIWDTSLGNNQRNKVVFFAGKDANNFLGQFCLGVGYYSRDRSANNWRNFGGVFTDWSAGGVTGQCACVYVGDNPTYASCVVLEPQITSSWTDTSITVPHFNQGALKNGSTGYIFVATEAGASGTAVAAGSISIGTANVPTITTSTLPAASVGVAYSTALSATGGVSPYTWYLPTVLPNTGSWLSINSSTGVLSGTPGTIETESVYVGLSDANGNSTYTTLSLTVQNVAPSFFISSTGSDANSGTSIGNAWAITSLQQSNSNNSKMAGKVVAIVGNSAASPTTYDISTFPKNGPTACKVSPPAGTVSASTTVIAVNASGVYTPLCVRLLADPAASGYVLADCFGHSSDGSAPNGQYITVKGIWVDGNGNTTGTSGISGFNFCGPSGFGSGLGIVIQDCKSTGWIAANGNSNFGCIKFDGTISHALVSNCVLSNCYQTNISKTTHGNGSCVHDYGQFLTTQYCDMSSAHNAIYQKESNAPPQGATVQYNYIHAGLGMGPSFAGFNNANGASPPYAGATIRNNIMENSGIIYISAEGNAYLSAPMAYYNNTFYSGTGAPSEHSIGPVGVTQAAGASWNITNHDNIVFYDSGTSIDGTWGIGCYGPTSTDKTIWDFNCYFSASGSTIQAGIATLAGSGSVTLRAKAAFIALAGTPDVHSLWATNPQFSSSITLNGGSAQYKLQATSPCIGTGNGGATMGAWGGTDVNTGQPPAQIGATVS